MLSNLANCTLKTPIHSAVPSKSRLDPFKFNVTIAKAKYYDELLNPDICIEAEGKRLTCNEVSNRTDEQLISECQLPAQLYMNKKVEVTLKMFCAIETAQAFFYLEWGKLIPS